MVFTCAEACPKAVRMKAVSSGPIMARPILTQAYPLSGGLTRTVLFRKKNFSKHLFCLEKNLCKILNSIMFKFC